MATHYKPVNICVGRQIGSGGNSISRHIAKAFGLKLYDREILNMAAKESGFCEKFFERCDESKSIFKSAAHFLPLMGGGEGHFYRNKFSEDGLFKIQSDAILQAARSGGVFVGRCADYVLRGMDTVTVFVTADMDDRTRRIALRKDCTEEEARKAIEGGEAKRASYYNYYTGKKWGHSSSYDLCVNSSVLGIEATALLIEQFVRQKMSL